MDSKHIIETLLERGYDPHSARLVVPDLLQLSNQLQPLFNNWLNDENCQADYSVEGYAISSLVKERGMKYPAALLTIDWIIKEPEIALRSLTKGIK